MGKTHARLARKTAQAARLVEPEMTGHTPKVVAVVLCDTRLVATLPGALLLADRALAGSPARTVLVQDFHRRLVAGVADVLRREIKRVNGRTA